MGPWLCSHGNAKGNQAESVRVLWLQWGRGCVATEISKLTQT